MQPKLPKIRDKPQYLPGFCRDCATPSARTPPNMCQISAKGAFFAWVFRMQHHSVIRAGGQAVRAGGILSGTPIATPSGWRQVETLLPDDAVLTFEAGPQPLTEVELLPFDAEIGLSPHPYWPLHVPVWALDNRADLMLLPETAVLIESDAADDLYGDPFALIPATALIGFHGIDVCRPPDTAQVVRLGFATDQIIYAARGVLLSCPALHLDLGAATAKPEYPMLSEPQARALVSCLMAEDIGAALRRAGQTPGQAACF